MKKEKTSRPISKKESPKSPCGRYSQRKSIIEKKKDTGRTYDFTSDKSINPPDSDKRKK